MNYKTVIWVIVLSWVVFGFNQKQDVPEGFVYVTSEIPDLDVELSSGMYQVVSRSEDAVLTRRLIVR